MWFNNLLTDFTLADLKTWMIVGISIILILIVWAIVSSFVTVVDGLTIYKDKLYYHELMQQFSQRFVDIFSNSNYTQVKRQFLLDKLGNEIAELNRRMARKYIGTVLQDQALVYNIQTFPGDVPNNVYLKLPVNDNEDFIWCVFSDTKNRYIDFDKGEPVRIEGQIDLINLATSKLPNYLPDNPDTLFQSDFAVHLQDDAKMTKLNLKNPISNQVN